VHERRVHHTQPFDGLAARFRHAPVVILNQVDDRHDVGMLGMAYGARALACFAGPVLLAPHTFIVCGMGHIVSFHV